MNNLVIGAAQISPDLNLLSKDHLFRVEIKNGTVSLKPEQLMNFGAAPEHFIVKNSQEDPGRIKIVLTTFYTAEKDLFNSPSVVLTGTIIDTDCWRKILENQQAHPQHRNPPGKAMIEHLAMHMISLAPSNDNPAVFEYKFSKNERTGNYASGLSNSVDLKFTKVFARKIMKPDLWSKS